MDLSQESISGIKAWLESLSASKPGFRRRKEQDRAIFAIARCLEPEGDVRRVLAVEGPTGVGKSIAYLIAGQVAARRHKKTLVITTATVALQQQLAADLERIQQIAPWEVRTKVLKGRGRYLCDRNLGQLAGEDPDQLGLDLGTDSVGGQWPFAPNEAEKASVSEMRGTRSSGVWDGDMDLWTGQLSKRMRPLLVTTAKGCAGQSCPHVGRCAVMAARKGVFDADVVVVNHALLLADQRQSGGGALLPALEDSILVVDEAHHLPDVAVDAAAASMVLGGHAKRLKAAIEVVRKAGAARRKKYSPSAMDKLVDAEASIKTLLDHMGKEMGRQLDGMAGGNTTRYGKTFGRPTVLRLEQSKLEPLRSQMEATAGDAKWLLGQIEREKEKLTKEVVAGVQPGVVAKLTRELGESGEWAQSVMDTLILLSTDDTEAETPIARWVTRDGQGQVEIHASPVDASQWLADRVWRQAFGAIATSATLRSMGDFRHFAERSGLSRVRETAYLALPSPFDLGNAAVMHVPAMVSEPSSEDAYLAEVLIELNASVDPEESTLILCASTALMQALVDRLPPSWKDKVLMQGSQAIGPLLDHHRQSVAAGRGSILVGLATLAEGVDLPGKQCSHVVVVKLPFMSPNDPVGETRAEWLESRGRSAFAEILLPDAHRRLVQACGRLIRAESDTGRITVLDRRLLTKSYGRKMLDTLPPYRRDIGQVKSGRNAA